MRLRCIATLLIALAAIGGSTTAGAQQPSAKPGPRTIALTVGDPEGGKMAYSVAEIAAKPGERLRLTLVSLGQMPKVVMGHNWLLLKLGIDPKAFADEAAFARETDFIPPKRKAQILAHTELVGPGERTEVTFTAPTAPGRYPYLCTFPNHYAAGMAGVLIVK
jgi:azurin